MRNTGSQTTVAGDRDTVDTGEGISTMSSNLRAKWRIRRCGTYVLLTVVHFANLECMLVPCSLL